MIYETDKYTEFLCKHKVSPNQFYILWLIYTKDYKNQKLWVNEGGFKTEEIDDLIKKGLIIHFNPTARQYDTRDMMVSEVFAEEVLVEPEDAWRELFDAYPANLIVNGNKVPAKTLTYTDSLGVEKTYIGYIKKNKFLHARVISAINVWKAANNGFATIKIDKFVMGRYWEEIERTDEQSSPKSRNY
jgi:hypothetical protein